MGIVRAASIVVVLAVSFTVASPLAAAAPQGPWVQPAADLSATGGSASGPEITTAPDGTATAVWQRSNGSNDIIQAATRPPGGSFGAPIDISVTGRTAKVPQIATADDGTSTAVWSRYNGSYWIVQTATRPPGGSFGVPVDVSASGSIAHAQQISVTPDGTATVVWQRSNGSDTIVQAATRPPGGSFGAPVDLSTTGQSAYFPQISAAPDGTATVVWRRSNGSNDIIQAATRPPGGSFGPPVDLSASGKDADVPKITTALDGTATAVWVRYDGSNRIIQAAIRPPGGSFGAPTNLSPPRADAYNPQITAAPDGTSTAVWLRFNSSNYIIQASTRQPGGLFELPFDLSASGQDAAEPQITTAPDGTATAVWTRYNGSYNIIQAATRPPGGSFGVPGDLSVPGQDAYAPQVTAASDGTATAVWQRSNGSNDIIQTISTAQPPGKPRLKVTKVKPKKPKVKRGKTVKLKVTVRNTGDGPAKNAKLCVKLSKKVKKALKPKGKTCQKLSSIGAGKSKTKAFKLRATGKAKKGKKYKVKLKLTAKGAKAATKEVILKVR